MSGLVTDRDQIARFVEAMFRRAPPDTWASLRSFYDKGETLDGLPFAAEPVLITRAVGLDLLVDRAAAYATRCADHPRRVVFAPPVACFNNQHRARGEDLAASMAISIECDERARDAVATLAAIIRTPTVTVASGGIWTDPDTGEIEDKLHAHWRLTSAAVTRADYEKANLARKLACAIVGSDPTNNSLVHPIRWPGSWHRKSQPRMARIVDLTEAEVELDDALVKLTDEALRRGAARYEDDEFSESSGRTANVESLATWLRGIPNPHPSNDIWDWWNSVGMALHAATAGSTGGLALFHNWSARSSKYDARETERRWAHYHKHPATKMNGAAKLCHLFNKHQGDGDE